MRKERNQENYGIVLDFLSHGHVSSRTRNPIAQVLGEEYLVLLEVIPKKGVYVKPGERVYIGQDKRDKIHHVAGRIDYEKLTETAKLELESNIKKIVDEREEKFVNFFNKCGPVSTRLHTLEIIPRIGKKHMQDILQERRIKPFESFEDLKNRVKLIPDPKQAITKRIYQELQNKDKYKLFVG